MEMFVTGRQYGKDLKMKLWIADEIAKGNKPAISRPNGLFCANCNKLWEECYGECYE